MQTNVNKRLSDFKVAIINMSLGNLFSVKNAFDKLGANSLITSSKEELKNADALILPGVGAFNTGMENLKNLDLLDPIYDAIVSQKPIFGICLGMQLLLDSSSEFKNSKGLSLIHGDVDKFPCTNSKGEKLIVPHVGWNKVVFENKKEPLGSIFKSLDEEYFYFVHSFYVKLKNNAFQVGETRYGGKPFCSALCHKNIVATQFHPEKSGEAGIKLLSNWLERVSG